MIDEVHGVVDTEDGIVVAGPSLVFRVRPADAQRYGLSTTDIAEAVETARAPSKISSFILKDDRIHEHPCFDGCQGDQPRRDPQDVPLKTPGGDVVRS